MICTHLVNHCANSKQLTGCHSLEHTGSLDSLQGIGRKEIKMSKVLD